MGKLHDTKILWQDSTSVVKRTNHVGDLYQTFQVLDPNSTIIIFLKHDHKKSFIMHAYNYYLQC